MTALIRYLNGLFEYIPHDTATLALRLFPALDSIPARPVAGEPVK